MKNVSQIGACLIFYLKCWKFFVYFRSFYEIGHDVVAWSMKCIS